MAGQSVGIAAITLVAAAASPAIPPGGIVQSYDRYGSWLVVCDNTLTCVAKGFSDEGQGAEIVVERAAGPDSAPTVSINAIHRFTLADLRIDDKVAGVTASAWSLSAADDETSWASNDLGETRALVQRLRNAAKVVLAGNDQIPLDGFNAAVQRMDDKQGRTGGVTALLNPGALPISHVPPGARMPHIPDHPIRTAFGAGEEDRLIANLRVDQKTAFEKEGCEEAAGTPVGYALDADRALVFIPCIMGAYQGSSLGFIASRKGGRSRRLSAPVPYLGNDPDRALVVTRFTDPVFDPKNGTLSSVTKGRAMADCGMSASWKWDGSAFRLSAMTLQQACGGVEPGDWPTLFRSAP